MHISKLYRCWKNIGLVLVIAGLMSTKAIGNPYYHHEYQIDTLEKISMMFMIHHGQLNSIDITNHPEFKSSSETYIFSMTTELPDGVLLSMEGTITWSPTADQFNQLKEHPIILDFNAHAPSDNYIIGQIRILGQGELLIMEPEELQADSIESSSIVMVDTSNVADVPLILPITIHTPETDNWNSKKEGESFIFEIDAKGGLGEYKFELLEPELLMGNLDQYGNFNWSPDFDFVTSDERIKSVLLKIKVFDTEGNEAFKTIPLYVEHVNRPPIVNELPTFYIQYNSANTYQLKKEGLVYDPDGDSVIFRPVLKELPQGMTMDNKGDIFWKPSNRQFNYLGRSPIYLSFSVEDYPEGAKSIGQIKIEVSQADLPPQIHMIPKKKTFEIKENEELQLSFYIIDPNGEDDLLSFNFVTENRSFSDESLKKKGNGQYEFKWTPGYDFIKETGKKNEFDISFFAIDKEGNRTERNILVTVEDAENLLEKDRIYYDQYRTVLERAWDLISQLIEKEKELEKEYKHARKGKKNRAISMAGLGALTGLSPIIFMDNPDGQKIAAGLGGTATATLGSLEASDVIGEPPSDIMRKLSYVSQKRNDLLIYGNIFASKYALPLSKRDKGFQSDLRSLSIHLRLSDAAKLELDSSWENSKKPTAKNIKKIFKDFNSDQRFEKNYKN